MTNVFLQVYLLNAQTHEILKTLRIKTSFYSFLRVVPSRNGECIQGGQDLTGQFHLVCSSLFSHPFFSKLQKSFLLWQSLTAESMKMRKNISLKVLSQAGGHSVQLQATSWLWPPHNPSLANYRHIPQKCNSIHGGSPSSSENLHHWGESRHNTGYATFQGCACLGRRWNERWEKVRGERAPRQKGLCWWLRLGTPSARQWLRTWSTAGSCSESSQDSSRRGKGLI